jgi:pimeloyl-ACP methyl ester carboxylesterase
MRTLISLLSIVASIYVLLALTVYLLQGKMVFLSGLPGRALTASPGDIGLDYQDVSLTTGDNERLHGWYVPATSHRSTIGKGVVLFFHGNAGNISHRLDSIRIFHQLGLDTLIIDYRGYGQSTGKTTEQGTYLDAQAAWNYLVDERGIPADQIRSPGYATRWRNMPAAWNARCWWCTAEMMKSSPSKWASRFTPQ